MLADTKMYRAEPRRQQQLARKAQTNATGFRSRRLSKILTAEFTAEDDKLPVHLLIIRAVGKFERLI